MYRLMRVMKPSFTCPIWPLLSLVYRGSDNLESITVSSEFVKRWKIHNYNVYNLNTDQTEYANTYFSGKCELPEKVKVVSAECFRQYSFSTEEKGDYATAWTALFENSTTEENSAWVGDQFSLILSTNFDISVEQNSCIFNC